MVSPDLPPACGVSGADDEEAAGLMKATEPIEVDVSAIHDVDGTGLGHQLIEDIDVVQLAVADEDEGRDIAPQIKERVQLARRSPARGSGGTRFTVREGLRPEARHHSKGCPEAYSSGNLSNRAKMR